MIVSGNHHIGEIMECILAWIEAHPGLSSWIQAIFGIVAIGVAIFVPYRQNKNAVKLLQLEFKNNQRLEASKLAYENIEKITAILAIVSQVQAFINLLEVTSKENGWHVVVIDATFLEVSIEQMKNLPIFEIPEARIIIYIASLPVAIKKMQTEWENFRDTIKLAGNNASVDAFLTEKESVVALIADCIKICNEKISELEKVI